MGRQTGHRDAIPFSFQDVANGQRHKKAATTIFRTAPSATEPDGSRCKRRTPSTSEPEPAPRGTRIPGTFLTRDALAAPRPYRTKGDRHRARAPGTNSAVRSKW